MWWTQARSVAKACFVRWLGLAALMLALAHAGPAFAQSPEVRKRAGKLFKQGVAHFEAQRYEQALEAFEEAYRLSPHPAVRVNMAGCFAKLGRPVEALFNYQRFLEESRGNVPPGQRRDIQEAIASLERKVGEVQLAVQPNTATVHIDGEPLRPLPDGRVVMAAGNHSVEVFAKGYERHEGNLTVRGGETSTLVVNLVPLSESTATASTSLSVDDPGVGGSGGTSYAPRADERPWWMRNRTHWGFLGAGLVLGAGAVIAGGITLKANNDFDGAVARVNDPDATELERAQARSDGLAYADRSEAAGMATDVLMASAIALSTGSFIMWLVTRSRDKQAANGEATLALPLLGQHRAGVMLSTRY